ncbi:Ankyrin repeat domain-containing protein 55 [Exaiptasia diaphana]|nr:Ankyrin repeat domain-containing protein 55 [Exaiptasia diaphana]
MRWIGHMIRMDDGRIPKDILYGELIEGKRPIGKPKLRFKDICKRDLKSLRIDLDKWGSIAADRTCWKHSNGSVDCCRAILNTVAGQHLLNGKDFSGKTPIHFAAAAGHVDALQELITEKFANIGLGDAEDRTPLHWAAATGHALCALVLLRAGADKDCVDKDGASPLMYAQQRGHKLCSELIFNHDPENPLNTRLADNIVETSKPSTPPEIHIDTSPGSFSMNGKVSRNSSRNSSTTKLRDIEKTDDNDNEVQEIFSQNVEEVLVEVNNTNTENSESENQQGEVFNTMNGHHNDGDNSGFSSDDEFRYPPQMVLTPIPGTSPIHIEDNDHDSFENRPPIPLSRFSFEENIHAPFLKPPSTAAVLAPLRPKRVPEHLRLDVGYSSSTAKTFEFKPVTSPASEPTLAPLKISKVKQQPQPIKQQGLPLMQQPIPNRQLVASPTKTARSGGSAQNREGGSDSDFSRFWARKKKQEPVMKPSSSSSRCKQMNRSLSIPEETRSGSGSKGASGFTYGGSDLKQFDSDSEFSRKLKDKQPLSGGQILPAISNDKPSKISQGQGSFRDHIARFRRSVKKKQKNKSANNTTDSFDDGYEENSRPAKPKEKKKIRKVMSWNT